MRVGRNRNIRLMAFGVTVALIMIGCNRKTIYSDYCHITHGGWEQGDTLQFKISPVRYTGFYEGAVGLRSTIAYPYQQLSMIVEQRLNEGYTVFLDTVEAVLQTPEGQNKGKGVSTFQYVFPYRRFELNAGDSMVVLIRHYMKRSQLPGIVDVGFMLQHCDPHQSSGK